MKKVEIPKGKGGTRLIYVPNRKEKFKLRTMVSEIARKAELAAPENVVHGFAHRRSIVTNAEQHIGHLFTLSFDLKDFFETVTEEKLRGKLNKEELSLVLVDGAARQGLPTSPAVANLAASDLDKAILKWRDKNKVDLIYTRYADDLTFSYDREDITELLLLNVKKIVHRCGFHLNEKKTHLQKARQGRRIITGVAVDDSLHPPRSVKRRLRAAKHQGKVNQAKGLEEFCKFKPPKVEEIPQFDPDELDRLCTTWNLSKLKHNKIPKKETEWLGEVLITGDPVYMLGMSTWTTGWTSCMRQPNGQYRRGVLFWCYLKGTRIACLPSDKVMSVAGIERRVMRARCLVHELRNGVKVYDRFYGDWSSVNILRKKLEEAGYIDMGEARMKSPGVRSGPLSYHLLPLSRQFKSQEDYCKCRSMERKESEGCTFMTHWEEKLTKLILRIDLILLFIPDEFEEIRADMKRNRDSLLFCSPEGAHLFAGEISDIMGEISTTKEPWVETVLTIWTGQRVIL